MKTQTVLGTYPERNQNLVLLLLHLLKARFRQNQIALQDTLENFRP